MDDFAVLPEEAKEFKQVENGYIYRPDSFCLSFPARDCLVSEAERVAIIMRRREVDDTTRLWRIGGGLAFVIFFNALFSHEGFSPWISWTSLLVWVVVSVVVCTYRSYQLQLVVGQLNVLNELKWCELITRKASRELAFANIYPALIILFLWFLLYVFCALPLVIGCASFTNQVRIDLELGRNESSLERT